MTSEPASNSSESENGATSKHDPDQYFETAHLTADLKGRTARGGAATMIGQAGRILLTITSTMVLARLLTPDDVGLVAMVTAISGFVALFNDLGLSMATVQRPDINHRQVSTLFWIVVAISAALALILTALALPIAWFYGEPRLTTITLVLATGIPVSGLAIQHQALLRRQMRFAALAGIELISTFLGISVTIALAAAGKIYWPKANYWALVALPLTMTLVRCISLWIVCRWRPAAPVRGSGVRPFLHFGAGLSGVTFLGYLIGNLDKILIGRFWGPGQLGAYSYAFRLLMLPLTQIVWPVTTLAVPVFSRLVDSPDRYRVYFRQGVLLIVTATMPLVAFSYVAADELILFCLGPQWTDSAAIFRALAPGAFVSTFVIVDFWIYLSSGRTGRQFRATLFSAALFAVSYLAGLKWGAIGVASAFSITQCTIRIPMFLYCSSGTPVRLGDLTAAIWRPAVAAISAGLITMLLRNTLPWDVSLIERLLIDSAIFAVSYLLLTLALPGGRSSLSQAFELIQTARSKTPSSTRSE